MRQKHQKVSLTGDVANSMKTAVIKHSVKHEARNGKQKRVDLLFTRMRKS